MITCIAIDDEPKALEVIKRYCEKTNMVSLKNTFREPVKAIEFLQHEKVDLIFLDINMPDISGLQLVQTLHPRPMIIFTTAYRDYAVESYDLDALDFLLKPIAFERFLIALKKATAAHLLKNTAVAEDESAVLIKSGTQTYRVKVADILYLEKDRNYLTVHLQDKQILIRENMSDIFDLVPAAGFVRVHKSYVVAIRHITMIEVHQLTINGEKIPIGNTYRESLRMRLGMS